MNRVSVEIEMARLQETCELSTSSFQVAASEAAAGHILSRVSRQRSKSSAVQNAGGSRLVLR